MALRITGLGEEIAAVTGLPWHINLEEWPEDPALAEKRGQPMILIQKCMQ
jgi:hypothetical protein